MTELAKTRPDLRRRPQRLLIAHNLDVITEADWVIDLDPDGGGRIVAQCPPEKLTRTHRRSEAARVLRAFLEARAFAVASSSKRGVIMRPDQRHDLVIESPA